MKVNKMFLAALAVMMIFAVAPLASAGTGTEDDPYTVLYVGYEYPGFYTSMIDADVDSEVVSNVTTGNIVYYETTYTQIDYDVNYLPTPASLDAAADVVTTSGGYDYLITDMAFTGYSYDGGVIDEAREVFYNACDASTITHKASIIQR
ncbi:MAG: hypothetical protein LBU81_08500 [Methanosarcinales archaeon]|jgi:hypothetical protein|nr:hypothetical protein [Methanosarcinales archaeon]